MDTSLNYDTRQAQNDVVQTMPALAELLAILIKALMAKLAEEKEKQGEASSPSSRQVSESDPWRELWPENSPESASASGIHQENTYATFNGIVAGGAEPKQLSSSATHQEEIENKIAAAAAANLCQEMGIRHANGIAYKSDDYLIHGSENPDGSISYVVRSVETDGSIRRVLDFTVSAETLGAESIQVHDAPLSEQQRKEFVDAGKAIAVNPTEFSATSYTEKQEKLRSLAPYGTRAAAHAQRVLNDYHTGAFAPVIDLNNGSTPYTMSKVEDGIVITDNASGSVILSANGSTVNAERFSAKNQADFRQMIATYNAYNSQQTHTKTEPAATNTQEYETFIQPDAPDEVEEVKTEFVTEEITADEMCEWINAIQATGGSTTDLDEALAYASEARRGHPAEFEKLKQKGGADKNKHGKQPDKKIPVQMPAHIAEKRNGAVKIYREMQNDYGAQGVIQIINEQRVNPVKIVDADAQIGKDANGKIRVKGKGAARNQPPKNQQQNKKKAPALVSTATKSKGFER